MNAMTLLRFDIKETSQICLEHNTPMSNYRGHIFCKQCDNAVREQGLIDGKKELAKMIYEKHFGGAKIPARHANSGFQNYTITNDGQKIAKQQCMVFTRDFKQGIQRNLIMVGRTGTGKTHLACAVARNVLETRKYARYVTSEDMANEIANAWSKADDNEVTAVHRFTDYDLLILDEYGLHDRHENRLQLVHKVLYSRYDAGKPTMLISNMTVSDLQEDLGDRLWSRFQHDGLGLLECNWADQRVGGVV